MRSVTRERVEFRLDACLLDVGELRRRFVLDSGEASCRERFGGGEIATMCGDEGGCATGSGIVSAAFS